MGESRALSTQGGREPKLQQCLTYHLTLSRIANVVTPGGGVVLTNPANEYVGRRSKLCLTWSYCRVVLVRALSRLQGQVTSEQRHPQ